MPLAYRTKIEDILLIALFKAYHDWTKEDEVVITLEGHGREELPVELDLSRTVGWFTTIYPVHLSFAANKPIDQLIKSVKEQLHAIPNKGLGYGVWLYQQPAAPTKNIVANLGFNYLGQIDAGLPANGLFELEKKLSAGKTNDFRNVRPTLLDLNGLIAGNKLHFNLTYSTNFYREETVAKFAGLYHQALREIIAYCVDKTILVSPLVISHSLPLLNLH